MHRVHTPYNKRIAVQGARHAHCTQKCTRTRRSIMTELKGLPVQVYTQSPVAVISAYLSKCTPARDLKEHEHDGVLVALDMLPDTTDAHNRVHACLYPNAQIVDNDKDAVPAVPKTQKTSTPAKSRWPWIVGVLVVVLVAVYVFVVRRRSTPTRENSSQAMHAHPGSAPVYPEEIAGNTNGIGAGDGTSWYAQAPPQTAPGAAQGSTQRRVLPPMSFEE